MVRDAHIARIDPLSHPRPVLGQLAQQLLELRRQRNLRIEVRQDTAQRQVAFGHHHAELGQQAAQPIADRQALGLVTLAHAVPGQPRLLLDRFDRHEAHIALAGGRGDGLRIVAIVLGPATLAVGRDQVRRHHARL